MSLEALARGLRSAGGVLSPGVNELIAREGMADDAARRQENLLHLQSRLQQEAQKASPEYQARLQAIENDKKFRDEWGKLGPNASMFDRANLAAQYGKPELSVQLYQGEQNRIAQAEARREALQARLYEIEQRSQDRALDREQKDRLAAQADETRRYLAGLTAEIAKGGQDLRLAMLDFQLRGKADERLRSQVKDLGAALEKANLPEADAVLGAVEKAIEKAPNLPEYLAGPKSAVPDLAVGLTAGNADDIRAGRQAFQKLFNITLKNRSGAAVTIPEFERLKKEFATGVWKTPEQIKEGVRQARDIIQKHYASVSAGFGPDVLKAYNDNLQGLGLGRSIQFGGSTPAASGSANDPLGIR